jgi:hypothetical protein
MTGGPCIAAAWSITATGAARAFSIGHRNTLFEGVILRSAQSLAESYLSGAAMLTFPFFEQGSREDADAERLSDHVDGTDVRPASDD